ncbi:Oligopeptide transport system permease protein OppB (TC 3.A.1.5.1) [hydrothermal vent metagenome]|uniref:Oligopeptide transport system permease protein OppB (TC 3.A.1.5.1) n=1 Tax=hydrothermal vent metagenome TaxID=652676 RepID=A0A1W1BUC4_9ZZZZ
MNRVFAKKILYIISMLFLISLISFGMIHLAPNSFFAAGGLNPNITPESIEHLKSVYGLDKPLYMQYFLWLKAIVHLDFGLSFASGQEVLEMIGSRIGITLGMNLTAMVFVFLIAVKFGVDSAMRGGRYEESIKQLSLLSYATPSFYLALLLVLFFALKLKWFPISGLEGFEPKEGIAHYIDMAYHMVLPISVMVFVGFGSLLLYVRSLTLDILKSDYIFFARARGVDDRELKKIYIYPNLKPFIITILGLSLPGLMGGSVILEQIFSIDGMGLLFYQSALSRDYPVIMGILIIGAFLTLLGNVIADMVLLKINPHYRAEK